MQCVHLYYYAQNNEYTYSEVDRLSSVYTNTTMNFVQDNEYAYSEVDRLSSVLPTMWLGSQSGKLRGVLKTNSS